ncbi:hypothetical protein FLLO111716_04800 [Flavobacterium longum]|uniref:PH domain-containing protein n=1 Tax=Flavobacterium longum TaxID=1299340 RepID=UPI0039E8D257
MEFGAPKSIWIKVIMLILGLVLFFLNAPMLFAMENADGLIFPAAILLLVFGVSYYFSIKKYEVLPGQIVVHRPFDKVVIRADGLVATRVEKKDIRFSIRTFGIGGIFSFTGTFWNRKFGAMTWYVTDMARAVLLTDPRTNKTIISPDDPEKFIATFNA